MPELPEVETVCRGLNDFIINDEFTSLEYSGKKLRIEVPSDISKNILNSKIKEIKRRAKYILAKLENNKTLIIHLGMSGKVIVHKNFRNHKNNHDHLIFKTKSGKEIVYNDPRRFGLVTYANDEDIQNHKLFKHLGLEPLENNFNGSKLYNILKNKITPIKLFLMNNENVVGVGNIYACESLFSAGIAPNKPANKVTKKQANTLVACIKEVLLKAIESGGSTLKDYVNSSGDSGYFQHEFKVYGKENLPCIVCNNKINKIKQGNRSTFYCKKCQK